MTNHASLKWLQTLKEPEGRLARWALSLQAYNFTISHRPGTAHQNADCLSRLPTIAILSPEADWLYGMLHNPNEWNSEPPEVRSILKRLSKGTSVRNNQLYKEVNGKKLPYIKPSARMDIILMATII